MTKFFALAFSISCAGVASANITFFDYFRTGAYQQTGETTTSFIEYRANARITSDTPGELVGGTFVDGNGASYSMSLNGTNLYGGSIHGPTDASLVSQAGSGTFNYKIVGGSHDGETASLSEPSIPSYPDMVPLLTNNSYTNLQNVDASQAVSLTWNTFSASGNFQLVFFDIYDITANFCLQ